MAAAGHAGVREAVAGQAPRQFHVAGCHYGGQGLAQRPHGFGAETLAPACFHLPEQRRCRIPRPPSGGGRPQRALAGGLFNRQPAHALEVAQHGLRAPAREDGAFAERVARQAVVGNGAQHVRPDAKRRLGLLAGCGLVVALEGDECVTEQHGQRRRGKLRLRMRWALRQGRGVAQHTLEGLRLRGRANVGSCRLAVLAVGQRPYRRSAVQPAALAHARHDEVHHHERDFAFGTVVEAKGEGDAIVLDMRPVVFAVVRRWSDSGERIERRA